MKHIIALFGLSALLAGCVAVPYDADTVYYPAPAVSATISSGYYHGYPAPNPYYRPYPYYQPPAYVTPAPVIVAPPVQFNYNRNVRPGVQERHHQRQEGAEDGQRRRDGERPDWQRRDGGRQGGRPEWRRDDPSGQSRDHFRNR
ncbi:hypothetical protein [Janthinobacterium sp. 17J80-10]|uniref:hypothetical protein n=1 Tax=Janthinobacterium sp. 17J80-10 TaxID=2497863 RepID=UPI0010054CEA|nr:hypothetical protein [Janthinobacterium sp. 17J80-10]QAU34966.1 hypothetical protein EKL02_12670 [Janthinobacterium sp. 17J80-10]